MKSRSVLPEDPGILVEVLNSQDQEMVRRIMDFVPERVFDIHSHLFRPDHFVAENLVPLLRASPMLDMGRYRAAMARWLTGRAVEGLFFGFPSRGNDRGAINAWVAQQVRRDETNCRALGLASPEDDPGEVAEQVRRLGLVGIKPYYAYAPDAGAGQARVVDFAPEWMWEICHGMEGVLMLHMVRDRAIADPENQAAIRGLCRRYPRCRLVLAHVARCFSYRHAREGLASLIDLDQVVVDTSAITECEAMRCALETLGPRRVLYGSDYPVSEMRGRCVAIGDSFFWIHGGRSASLEFSVPRTEGTLVGLESLLCLREACEDAGLTATDVQDVFRNNALRLLAPHLTESVVPRQAGGPDLWTEAWKRISCGTGLLSKRAERFDPKSWPSYFSRCLGSHVWDAGGRRYLDFNGCAGAVLLGYADPDVTRAVRRRLNLGTNCTLCVPDEVELAGLLLEIHPWAQRVRFARGGGEAMAVAVRVARAATGKSGIAFCGYHGWQDWYLAANLGDDSSLDGHLLPGLQPLGVPRELQGTAVPFRYNDLASFEEALRRLEGRLAAVVMEPMRSQEPQPGFLEEVARRCRAAGAVLVVDEITSGWRFGFPGACGRLGISPDVAVYAKAMSNGFPCAAVVGRAHAMDAANPSFISSSYWTDGVGPAAALACIRRLRVRGVQERVWQLGERLKAGLEVLARANPSLRLQVGGMPCAPSLAFDLGASSAAARALMVRKMLARGYLFSSQLYLMFSHTEAEVEGALEATAATLGELGHLLEGDRLMAEAGPLGGDRAAMGQPFARLA